MNRTTFGASLVVAAVVAAILIAVGPTEVVSSANGPTAYVLVGAMAFLETGVPLLSVLLPAELTVAFGGALAAAGRLDLLPLAAVVWTCSMLGDWTSFLIGRKLGTAFLARHGDRVGLTSSRIQRVKHHYARFGGASVVIARFVPVLRALSPFVAGAARLSQRRFALWDLLATVLFTIAFIGAGYAGYEVFEATSERLDLIVVLAVAALLIAVGWRKRSTIARRYLARSR